MKSNRLKPIYCIDDLLHKALLNDKKVKPTVTEEYVIDMF